VAAESANLSKITQWNETF